MSRITEYLHGCAVQYRTKQQQAFVELALKQFDTDDLEAAFEAHGFRVEYDSEGLMQVDWMQGGLPDADGQAEAAEG